MHNTKKYKCKNLGRRNIFDWPAQLVKHSRKCSKPQPVEEKQKYFQEDGAYIYCQCNKECTRQPNIIVS